MKARITRFAHYVGAVHIRRAGWPPVKPEAEALDGKTLHVTAGSEIEDGLYAGETEMLLRREDDQDGGILWIASGDFSTLREVPK